MDWEEVHPSDRLIVRSPDGQGEGLECRFVATDHGPPTLAVGITPATPDGSAALESPLLAYSADTGPDWSAEELGRGIGTLLCEATHLRDEEGRLAHLSGRQAGRMAAAAGVGTLVVTHRWPTVSAESLHEEAATAFEAEIAQAKAGLRIEW
jgi:ribonuclease BN (tRNA processing enzyme)